MHRRKVQAIFIALLLVITYAFINLSYQLISEEIKSNYTDFNGTIMIYEDDFGEFLRFTLEAIDINTNDLVIFEIDVYYIGQIILNLPEA